MYKVLKQKVAKRKVTRVVKHKVPKIKVNKHTNSKIYLTCPKFI